MIQEGNIDLLKCQCHYEWILVERFLKSLNKNMFCVGSFY